MHLHNVECVSLPEKNGMYIKMLSMPSFLTERITPGQSQPKSRPQEHNLNADLVEFSVYLGISEALPGVEEGMA